jgi:heptosyltransferase-2
LLDGLPGLNVIRFERGRLANAWRSASAAKELFGLGKWLRDMRFDLVIDLQGLFRSGWMAWQTKAPVRSASTTPGVRLGVLHAPGADRNGRADTRPTDT